MEEGYLCVIYRLPWYRSTIVWFVTSARESFEMIAIALAVASPSVREWHACFGSHAVVERPHAGFEFRSRWCWARSRSCCIWARLSSLNLGTNWKTMTPWVVSPLTVDGKRRIVVEKIFQRIPTPAYQETQWYESIVVCEWRVATLVDCEHRVYPIADQALTGQFHRTCLLYSVRVFSYWNYCALLCQVARGEDSKMETQSSRECGLFMCPTTRKKRAESLLLGTWQTF